MAKKRKPTSKAERIFVTIMLIIIFTAGFFYYTGLDPLPSSAAVPQTNSNALRD